MTNNKKPKQKPLGPLMFMLSAIAAAFGVQSSKNHQRDFTKGHILGFISAGIVLTISIIIGIAFLVNMIAR